MMTVVGQCYGADEMQQARGYAKKFLGLNYMMLAVICAVMICGVGLWVGFYGLSGAATDMAVQLVIAHSVAMIIWPTGFLFPSYYRAIGRATFTMMVAIITMAVFRVGLAYLFVVVLGKGVVWVWYAMFVDWFVRTIVYLVAFRKHFGEQRLQTGS